MATLGKTTITELEVSGNTYVNNISYKGAKSSNLMIRFLDGPDAYGNTTVIGFAGGVIIGAGESTYYYPSLLTNYYLYESTAYPEDLHLLADNLIIFQTGCDRMTTSSPGSSKRFIFNKSGYFYPESDSTGSLGTSLHRWDEIHGKLAPTTIDDIDSFLGGGIQYGFYSVPSYLGFLANNALIISIPLGYGDTLGSQIALDDETSAMAIRSKPGEEWTEWERVVTLSQLDELNTRITSLENQLSYHFTLLNDIASRL